MKAILFDLDGTLLPMDQDKFTNAYLNLLSRVLEPHGYAPDLFYKAMWSGIKAMLTHDGTHTNDYAFWQAFSAVFGERVYSDFPLFDAFYMNEFDTLKTTCGVDMRSGGVIKQLKRDGFRLVLATNPVFPFEAYKKRTAWTGVDIGDFELVTTYENSHYCKPRVGYYAEIAKKIGVEPADCLMVGNDVGDDMPAADIGMKVFLMPEHLINKPETPIENFAHGGFDELLEYIYNN